MTKYSLLAFLISIIVFVHGQNVELEPNLGSGTTAVAAESSKFLPADVMKYPSESIQCMSSLTKPDQRLICPAARAYWCVKEVSDLTQDICGATVYYGDEYVSGKCEFKKCAAECEQQTISFIHEGRPYTRSTYCCKDQDYCNSAPSSTKISWIVSLCSLLIGLYYLR